MIIQLNKPFPDKETEERIRNYQINRLLYEGKHDEVFSASRYSILRNSEFQREFNFNLFKLASHTFADLLFGEEPHIKTTNQNGEEYLEKIITQTQLQQKLYSVMIDVHRYGTGLLKIFLENGEIGIDVITPSGWIPVFNVNNRNIMAHLLWTINGDELETEWHTKGKIITATYSIRNGIVKSLLNQEEQETGINNFLVVDFQNSLTSDRYIGYDEYTDLETIIDGLETRFIQRAKILDAHADPSMTGPNYEVKIDPMTGRAYAEVGGGKYFPRENDEPEIKYITWNGQLDGVQKEIDDLKEMFYVISGVSPALVGVIKPGLAESGSALKRLLIRSLAKVNRYRKIFDVKIKTALAVATQLAAANNRNAVQLQPNEISIEWQDGLPNDYTQQVQDESIAVNNELTSRRSAIKRLYGLNGKALDNEIAQIKKELEEERVINTVQTPSLEASLNYLKKK